MQRDTAGEAAGFLGAQFGVEQQAVGEAARGEGVAAVVGVTAVEEHLPPDRAVEQPGVEMRQAEVRGESLGDGTLARGSGAVDGDDHSYGSPGKTILPSPEASKKPTLCRSASFTTASRACSAIDQVKAQ